MSETVRTTTRVKDVARVTAVGDDIRRLMDSDRRVRQMDKSGLSFLMAMGLTVSDPGDRVALLCAAVPYAFEPARW